MRLAIVAGLAFVFATSGFAASAAVAHPAAATQTPQQLRAALLGSTFASLPSGFSSPKVTLQKPTRAGQIGVVTVEVTGPDLDDLVAFSVYTSPRAALAAMRDPHWGKGFDSHEVVGRAPGWGKQSIMVVGTISGKNILGKTVTNGVTLLAALRGNVIIQAFTSEADGDSGDVLAARRLLVWAAKELDRVRRV